jgi:serine/threonine protein kinase/tetratricopeptide (TPR) repeat protein
LVSRCPKCHLENNSDSKFCKECGTQLTLDQPVQETTPSSRDIHVSHTETLEAPKEELTTGSLFARRYQIIEELGKGGMGKVYKAFDREISEKIAIKLLKPEIATNKRTIERFRNELKLARKIRHKNVCQMYDLNKEEGNYYITMQYVSGEDLKSFIRRSRQLTIGTAISIAKQICGGLIEAHKLGVIHRDLKPQNIMIDREGNAQIMDFGIARSLKTKGMTDSGTMMGTPHYMAPEQVEGKEIDERSDIYSLGVILYEMVTGKVPFEGDTALSIAVKHKTELPADPRESNAQVPSELSQVILKCMQKEKGKRIQSVEEVFSELGSIERGITTTGRILSEKKPETTRISEIEWKNSIAVLPFADMSPQRDQEYFCDGLAETLINALTSIKDLRVVARTSAFSFKGKDQDVREIGKKLNVNAVLEGSVQKADNRIRITAQLINVEDGYHIWSERYDRELFDVFAIQDEIGLAIVEQLRGKLLREEKEKLLKRHTDNAEAYNLYLKGLYFWNKRTGEGMKKGMAYFQQAVDSDPIYALAYCGLADSYSLLGFWCFLSPKDTFLKAKALAEKALEIDNTLAEAHASLAFINFSYDWDWSAAENGFEKSIKLNPGYATAHHWYGVYLTAMGRHEEAFKEMRRAQELDPLSLMINLNVGMILFNQRQYDKAIEQYRKTLEMDQRFSQTHYQLAKVYGMKDMYKDATDEALKAHNLGLPWASAVLGWVYGIAGERDEAEKLLQEMEELLKKQYISSMSLYGIYLGLGDLDKSIEWLEKAYNGRDPAMPFLKVSPEFDVIRSDPRYKALLKKIGFEE